MYVYIYVYISRQLYRLGSVPTFIVGKWPTAKVGTSLVLSVTVTSCVLCLAATYLLCHLHALPAFIYIPTAGASI